MDINTLSDKLQYVALSCGCARCGVYRRGIARLVFQKRKIQRLQKIRDRHCNRLCNHNGRRVCVRQISMQYRRYASKTFLSYSRNAYHGGGRGNRNARKLAFQR